MNNKIMLITYGDSMGNNLKELNTILTEHFKREIGSVHILPFFPSSADRGFAPERYDTVAPELGDFNDIKAISENFALMFDFMVNHISQRSMYFKDFQKNKDMSKYRNFFIIYKKLALLKQIKNKFSFTMRIIKNNDVQSINLSSPITEKQNKIYALYIYTKLSDTDCRSSLPPCYSELSQ